MSSSQLHFWLKHINLNARPRKLLLEICLTKKENSQPYMSFNFNPKNLKPQPNVCMLLYVCISCISLAPIVDLQWGKYVFGLAVQNSHLSQWKCCFEWWPCGPLGKILASMWRDMGTSPTVMCDAILYCWLGYDYDNSNHTRTCMNLKETRFSS